MGWELFNPEAEAGQAEPAGPLVKVGPTGSLLFNRRAWELLEEARRSLDQREVVLLFDPDRRVAGVRPVAAHEAPAGARLRVCRTRSVHWPYAAQASLFVDHYQVGTGQYPARLLLELVNAPRVLTFEVGAPRPLPVGVPPFGRVDEGLEDVGEVPFRDETQPRRPVGVPPFGG